LVEHFLYQDTLELAVVGIAVDVEEDSLTTEGVEELDYIHYSVLVVVERTVVEGVQQDNF